MRLFLTCNYVAALEWKCLATLWDTIVICIFFDKILNFIELYITMRLPGLRVSENLAAGSVRDEISGSLYAP
jgi:hypothetical protein